MFFNFECSGLESDFDAFWLSKTEYKSQLRERKGYLHQVLNVLCNNLNCQFEASELKNVEKYVKQTVQSLKSLGNVHFCTICEIIFLVGGR